MNEYTSAHDAELRQAESLINASEQLFPGTDALESFDKVRKTLDSLDGKTGREVFLKLRLRLYRNMLELFKTLGKTGPLPPHLAHFDLSPEHYYHSRHNIMFFKYIKDRMELKDISRENPDAWSSFVPWFVMFGVGMVEMFWR